MDASEASRQSEAQRFGVTININSPNNCIVSGDRIDINIHVGQQCERQLEISNAKPLEE